MGECGGRPELVRARKRLGMNQDEAAEALLVAPGTLSRWERGTQDVRPVYRARIAQVFGVSGAEVERWLHGTEPVATELWPLPDFSDLSVTATVGSAEKLWRGELDLDRRHLLATLPFVPAALDGWLSAWSYSVPVGTAARETGRGVVGLSDVARIEEMLRTFNAIELQYGGGVIRPAVVDCLNTVVAPLLRGSYTDDIGSALMSAAAGMTTLAGWTAFDLARHGQAQHYFGQALKLAKTADDPLTGIHVLVCMAQQAFHLNKPEYELLLARAATETARRSEAPASVMAVVTAKEARATGFRTRPDRTGDRHSGKRIERLIEESRLACARGADDRDPAWVMDYDEPEVGAQLSVAWRLLGRNDLAADYAERAVRAFEVRRPRSAQLNRVAAGHAYLGMGEVEQAVETVRAAVPAARSLASSRLVERIRRFDRRLRPYEKTVQVREFRAYLHQQLAS
ncbi:helix-turn-helix domain-containing protein [Nonomuraea sp. NPDC050783]|uniref:helix-turn-helix domain-containing protein n=1 Tax=Nonomuraea sp. NPDC050783 TaxID=3154634 RepID=UPI00346772C5